MEALEAGGEKTLLSPLEVALSLGESAGLQAGTTSVSLPASLPYAWMACQIL